MAKNNNLTDFLTSMANYIRGKFPNSFAGTPLDPQGFESAIDWGVNQAIENERANAIEYEYSRFWDSFQFNGTRRNYYYAFTNMDLNKRGWNNETLRPKHDLILTSAELMFRGCGYEGSLTELLNIQGITIDTSGCKGNTVNNMFSYSKFTEIPLLDFSNLTYMYQTFASSLIETVSIKVGENVTWKETFNGCSKLKNLTIIGTTGTNGLNVSYSPLLTHDSLMSIINALKDYSGSGDTRTCTLGATNLAKLTDAEKQQATNKGWTLA